VICCDFEVVYEQRLDVFHDQDVRGHDVGIEAAEVCDGLLDQVSTKKQEELL